MVAKCMSPVAAKVPAVSELSERDRQLLEFEATHPETGPLKNEAIRSQLQLSAARYYQRLERLTDSIEALQFDPLLIHRMRRLREERERQAAERTAPHHRS